MNVTPHTIRNKQFSTTRLRPGYDEEEVDAFLDEVEVELDRLIQENDGLRSRLGEALLSGRLPGSADQSQMGKHAVSPSHLALPPKTPQVLTDPYVREARAKGIRFGRSLVSDAPPLWIDGIHAARPVIPRDIEERLIKESSLPADAFLHEEVRAALRAGFWSGMDGTPVPPDVESLPGTAGQPRSPSESISAPDAFRVEETIDQPDGILHRFEFADNSFVLIDQIDRDTINWTTDITPRAFAGIAREYLLASDHALSATLSVAGVTADMGAGMAFALAETGSPSFDSSCDFMRFDNDTVSLAFQVLPGATGEKIRILGISAQSLSIEVVCALIVRTASRSIVGDMLRLRSDSLMPRISKLLLSGKAEASVDKR